jgi:hypothetical protein
LIQIKMIDRQAVFPLPAQMLPGSSILSMVMVDGADQPRPR